ncbi:hypothetical protein BXZ70DRAFT_917558 [Cristinia sonorae]|uniref:Uncharacterized protein n=1 Tax=Cristinia sonorae TaxID=1940300 RepID=A0A8K0UWW6_9AGAR|nr:hypothetical protein BXZ70DRAFT_917558 [Cristinia sonorae]
MKYLALAAPYLFSTTAYGAILPQPPSQHTLSLAPTVKVPVVLGVMSQCPDAILCESVFNDVIQEAGDKIDLSLTFIGVTNSSDPDFGVTCKHGPAECAGNVHELCAQKYEPFAKWWRFVLCQNSQNERSKIGTPGVTLGCAAQAGIDWTASAGVCAGPNGAANGEEGLRLLRESVEVTKSLNITKSCTIIINSKQVCIRDSTWYSCEGGHRVVDFVRQIEEEYEKLND